MDKKVYRVKWNGPVHPKEEGCNGMEREGITDDGKEFRDEESGLIVMQNGMTLRDYFAGQALAGFCVCRPEDDDPINWRHDRLASVAYAMADAMLAERDNG